MKYITQYCLFFIVTSSILLIEVMPTQLRSSYLRSRTRTCLDISKMKSPTSTLETCRNFKYLQNQEKLTAECYSKTENKYKETSITLGDLLIYDKRGIGLKWKSIPFRGKENIHIPKKCSLHETHKYIFTCFDDKEKDTQSSVDIYDGLLNNDGKLIANMYAKNYLYYDLIGHFYKKCAFYKYEKGTLSAKCYDDKSKEMVYQKLNVNTCFNVENCSFDGVELLCKGKKYNVIEYVSFINNKLVCPNQCNESFDECRIMKHSFQCNEEGQLCNNGICLENSNDCPTGKCDEILSAESNPKMNNLINQECDSGKCDEILKPILPKSEDCESGKCSEQLRDTIGKEDKPNQKEDCESGKCDEKLEPTIKPKESEDTNCETGKCDEGLKGKVIIKKKEIKDSNCDTGKCDELLKPIPIQEHEKRKQPKPSIDHKCPYKNGEVIKTFSLISNKLLVKNCGSIILPECLKDKTIVSSNCSLKGTTLSCNTKTIDLLNHIVWKDNKVVCDFIEEETIEEKECSQYEYIHDNDFIKTCQGIKFSNGILSATCINEKKECMQDQIDLSHCLNINGENIEWIINQDVTTTSKINKCTLQKRNTLICDNKQIKLSEGIINHLGHLQCKHNNDVYPIRVPCDEPKKEIEKQPISTCKDIKIKGTEVTVKCGDILTSIDINSCLNNEHYTKCTFIPSTASSLLIACEKSGQYSSFDLNILLSSSENQLMCTSLTFNRQIISLPRISFIYNACDNYYYDDKTKSIIGNCYDNNGVSIISSIFLPSIITFDINNKITWKSKSDTVIENSISFTTIQIVNGIYINNILNIYDNIVVINGRLTSIHQINEDITNIHITQFINTLIIYSDGKQFDLNTCLTYKEGLTFKKSNIQDNFLNNYKRCSIAEGLLVCERKESFLVDFIDLKYVIDEGYKCKVVEGDEEIKNSCKNVHYDEESKNLIGECYNNKRHKTISTTLNINYCTDNKVSITGEMKSYDIFLSMIEKVKISKGRFICKSKPPRPIIQSIQKTEITSITNNILITLYGDIDLRKCAKKNSNEEISYDKCIQHNELIICYSQEKKIFSAWEIVQLVKVKDDTISCNTKYEVIIDKEKSPFYEQCPKYNYDKNKGVLFAFCYNDKHILNYYQTSISNEIIIENNILKLNIKNEKSLTENFIYEITLYEGHSLQYQSSMIDIISLLIFKDNKIQIDIHKNDSKSEDRITLNGNNCNVGMYIHSIDQTTLQLQCESSNLITFDLSQCIKYDSVSNKLISGLSNKSEVEYNKAFEVCEIDNGFISCINKEKEIYHIKLSDVITYDDKLKIIKCSSASSSTQSTSINIFSKCHHYKYIKDSLYFFCDDNIDRSINIINFIDFYRQDKIINYDQCTLTTSFKLVCSELTINLYSSFILIDNKVKIIINGETYPKEIPKEISHNIIIENNILKYIDNSQYSINILQCVNKERNKEYIQCSLNDNIISCIDRANEMTAIEANNIVKELDGKLICEESSVDPDTNDDDIEVQFYKRCFDYSYEDKTGILKAKCHYNKMIINSELNIKQYISVINSKKIIWNASIFGTKAVSNVFTLNFSLKLLLGLSITCTSCSNQIDISHYIYIKKGKLYVKDEKKEYPLCPDESEILKDYELCYRHQLSLMCENSNYYDIYSCGEFNDYLDECTDLLYNNGIIVGKCKDKDNIAISSSFDITSVIQDKTKCKLEKGHVLQCGSLTVNLYNIIINEDGRIRKRTTDIIIKRIKHIKYISRNYKIVRDIISTCKDFNMKNNITLTAKCQTERHNYIDTEINLSLIINSHNLDICYLHMFNRGIYSTCQRKDGLVFILNLNEELSNSNGSLIKNDKVIVKKSDVGIYEKIFEKCNQFRYDSTKITAECFDTEGKVNNSSISIDEYLEEKNGILKWKDNCDFDLSISNQVMKMVNLTEGRYLTYKNSSLDLFSTVYILNGTIVIPQTKKRPLLFGKDDKMTNKPKPIKELELKPLLPIIEPNDKVNGFHNIGREWQDLHRGIFNIY